MKNVTPVLLVVTLAFASETAAADWPSTATIPDGMVTLRVDFMSKSKEGDGKTKVATPWDGHLPVSPGTVREARLWQEDARNKVKGTTWSLTTRRSIPWNTQQRARGHEAMPLQDGAILIDLVGVAPDTELSFQTELGNFLRCLTLPRGAKHWTLTTLRDKLIKIGAKVVRHARYVTFQLVEVAVPRRLYRTILNRIRRFAAITPRAGPI